MVENLRAVKGIQVVFVYMAEAHAVDVWPLTSSRDAPRKHGDAHERLSAAKAFLATYPAFESLVQNRWYLDDIDNRSALLNGLWPERYLLLEGQEVLWASTLAFEERFTDITRALCDAADRIWH